MRVQHHLSIILSVAVIGALGLVAAVGVLLGRVEDATRKYSMASHQQQQVDLLVADGMGFVEATGRLSARSTEESFILVDQAIEQSLARLVQLRNAPPIFDARPIERALEALRRCRALSASRSTGVQHPDELAKLRESAAVYASALGWIERDGLGALRQMAHAKSNRRRLTMLTIGVLCIFYLAVIERVRHWTTRGVIDPMQKLADAARQAMEGGGVEPGLDKGKTEELNTLANMLLSFADTIKRNVLKRTAQVVRQKEILEKEVRVRRRAEEELRYAAFHDRLTGLCNRNLLMDRLECCYERLGRRESYQCAVLFVDVDQFGEVSQDLGEIAGGQLLIGVAERFKAGLRDASDVIGVECSTLARVCGDEFLVLLDGIKDRADAGVLAERLQQALAEPIHLEGRTLRLSASIGIAVHEVDCETPEDLVKNADAAMHYAKAGGKSRHIVFERGTHDQFTAREERGNRLRRALENDELTIVYQPIVSLETGRVTGFEALARWEDPQRGAISPVEFVANAEESGVIVELGQWVLENACRQLQDWRDAQGGSRAVSISVNVSRQQLAHTELVDEVQRILETTGIAGTDLKLEITESVIMENPDAVDDVLRRLKELGIEIHMDDFGTGYSSLSYLHRLPIDVLKIDRAFMSALDRKHDYGEIVRTVVALARTLNLRVTAEGVEAEDQLAQVKALGCDHAQGFYFSKPLEAEAAKKLIASDHRWEKAAA